MALPYILVDQVILHNNSRTKRLCLHSPAAQLVSWHSAMHNGEELGALQQGAQGSSLLSSLLFARGHSDLILAGITRNCPPSKWICAK